MGYGWLVRQTLILEEELGKRGIDAKPYVKGIRKLFLVTLAICFLVMLAAYILMWSLPRDAVTVGLLTVLMLAMLWVPGFLVKMRMKKLLKNGE